MFPNRSSKASSTFWSKNMGAPRCPPFRNRRTGTTNPSSWWRTAKSSAASRTRKHSTWTPSPKCFPVSTPGYMRWIWTTPGPWRKPMAPQRRIGTASTNSWRGQQGAPYNIGCLTLTFICSTHSLNNWLPNLKNSFIHSVTHSFSHSVSHSLTHSLTHSVTQSFSHSIIHWLAQSLNLPLIHLINHSVTRSLTFLSHVF